MLPVPRPSSSKPTTISVTRILDDAFHLLQHNFRLCFGVVAVVLVPLTLIASVLSNRIAPDKAAHLRRLTDLTDSMQQGGSVADSTLMNAFAAVAKDYLKLGAVGGSIAILQYGLIGCALAFAVCQRHLLRETTFRTCYRVSLFRLGHCLVAIVVAAALLVGIGVLPALIASVAGSAVLSIALASLSSGVVLYLGVRLSPLIQVVTIEGLGRGALRRSFQLTRYYFWKTFGLLLLTGFVVVLMISLTDTIVTRASGTNEAVDTALTLVIRAATTPLILCTQILLYLQLRQQKEAYTSEALAADLDVLQAQALG